MSIVTRTGDKGMTGVVGGKRVSKTDARIHAVGDIDELNALLGIVRAEPLLPPLEELFTTLQHRLFTLGADIASEHGTPAHTERITSAHVAVLDAWIARLEPPLPPLTHFILPGGSPLAARLHHARAVCRRAERSIVALSQVSTINAEAIIYVNRLGDLLFLAARTANTATRTPEERVHYAP